MSKIIHFSLLMIIGLMLVSVSSVLGQVTTAEEVTPGINEDVELDENVEASDLGVSEPTLLPDSPFYFLKNWGRGIRVFFTFNSVEKVNLRLRFSAEKLLELRKLAEKTENPEILKKAVENYEKENERIGNRVEKIKEKANENPEVGKFLDKFTKHEILHQKILEKLEVQVPEDTFQRIEQARERHLERFGEVMEKLEEKDMVQERLEKNFKEIKGSPFKDLGNLEILKGMEEKAPEQAKEAVKKARENIFVNLKNRVEKMSSENQERFKNYIENIQESEEKMEILEGIKLELRENLQIQGTLNQARESLLERVQQREREMSCALINLPGPDFCPKGRIISQRDENGCIIEYKCIIPAETETPTVTSTKPLCITLWEPVCGKDGKTYSNACFAEVAGVKIDYKGVCKGKELLKKGNQ
jgi:hypothetical protein